MTPLVIVAFAILSAGALPVCRAADQAQKRSPAALALAREVSDMGWIAFGARTAHGDWDLFVMRPDGSQLRNLTNTPDNNEAAPRFSPDGRKVLYRRLGKEKRV